MPMTYGEHGNGLIDADDPPALDVLGQRPGDSPRAGRQIENDLTAFERQHFDQFIRERSTNTRHRRTPVELGGVRGIVKSGLVPVAVIVGMFVGMTVLVFVIMRVPVLMTMRVIGVTMLVVVSVLMLLVTMRMSVSLTAVT
jgi:hypothetical protein